MILEGLKFSADKARQRCKDDVIERLGGLCFGFIGCLDLRIELCGRHHAQHPASREALRRSGKRSDSSKRHVGVRSSLLVLPARAARKARLAKEIKRAPPWMQLSAQATAISIWSNWRARSRWTFNRWKKYSINTRYPTKHGRNYSQTRNS